MAKMVKGLAIAAALGVSLAMTGCSKEGEYKSLQNEIFATKVELAKIIIEKEIVEEVADFVDLKEGEQEKALEKEKERLKKMEKEVKDFESKDVKDAKSELREMDKKICIGMIRLMSGSVSFE